MQRVRRAFTLIELLVVVSIIVLLIAILLPSLSRAREVARRTVCLSNEHQMIGVALIYANENQGLLPPGPRQNGDEHLHWLSTPMYKYYTDQVLLPLEAMFCPDRPIDQWYVANPTGNGYRIGYYTMSGCESPFGTSPHHPWISAHKLGDRGDCVMIADIIERGTAAPNYTTSSHGPLGYVTGPEGVPLEPEQINSEGGNVGYLDGSASWKNQAEMVIHDVVWNHISRSFNSLYNGYW